MKISTKGRYALEAVTDLVLHAGDQYGSIRGIAQRRGLSDNYLEQLFLQLRRAGLVESVRGPQGGYRLARDPSAVSAGDVLRAAEGSLAPVDCLEREGDASCAREERCVTRNVWFRLSQEIGEVLDRLSIEALVAAVRQEQGRETELFIDYCI